MAKGTTKTSWEHFMTAAGAANRENRKNRTKTEKVLSLKEQINAWDRKVAKASKAKPVEKEQHVQKFSHAPDVFSKTGFLANSIKI